MCLFCEFHFIKWNRKITAKIFAYPAALSPTTNELYVKGFSEEKKTNDIVVIIEHPVGW